MSNLSGLANSMAGIEMNSAEQSEFQFALQRIRESLELLTEARGWGLGAATESRSRKAEERAAERGDEVMSWADRTDLSFTIRDEYYALALDYYDWCGCDDRMSRARAARESIRPDLEAEQARLQAQAEEAKQRLQNQADELQRAVDDMQKTEAEKKAFDEEADALEAELGF